jgi:hypothetical protein
MSLLVPILSVRSRRRRVARSLPVLAMMALAACGTDPTGHPLNTGAIPANAKVMDKCTRLGEMACSLVSGVHGDAGLERRSACVAYVSPDGTRTEQCGSVPVSQP